MKTFVVRYKCCYGFKRTDNSPGCSRQVDLKPLLDTIEAIDGQEFKKLVLSVGLDSKFSDENLTVFLPTNDALINFAQQMEDIVSNTLGLCVRWIYWPRVVRPYMYLVGCYLFHLPI